MGRISHVLAMVVLTTPVLFCANRVAYSHSLTTATCSGTIGGPSGDAIINVIVAPNGQISGTAGRSTGVRPFAAQPQPDGTVKLFRADGTIWYSDVTMRGGWFLGTYHRPPANGGAEFSAQLRCTN